MTVSPALNSAVGCSSSAMRASAARGSPWLPVARARIRSRGRRSNASMPRTAARRRASRTRARPRRRARSPARECRPAGRRRIPPRPRTRSRATLEAKVVTTTLPFALPMSHASSSATSRSDGLSPSRRTLVESQTSASTPSSPSALRRASSVGRPTIGVGSIFQSAGMDDEAGRRADRERGALRDRMGDGDEFDVERADRDAARRDSTIFSGIFGRAWLAEPARLGESGREASQRRPARRGSATARPARRYGPRAHG